MHKNNPTLTRKLQGKKLKFAKYYFASKQLKTPEFCQNTNVFGFKTAENCLMHKTCLMSQFLGLLLARFSAIWRICLRGKLREFPSLRNIILGVSLCI